MGKLSIATENHNIRNIIWNEKIWKTGMFFGRGETYDQVWTWTMATRVTYIHYMLAFLDNLKEK